MLSLLPCFGTRQSFFLESFATCRDRFRVPIRGYLDGPGRMKFGASRRPLRNIANDLIGMSLKGRPHGSRQLVKLHRTESFTQLDTSVYSKQAEVDNPYIIKKIIYLYRA